MNDRNQPSLRLCSACRGDYEDPEASASPDGEHVTPEDKNDSDREQDEFPVMRRRS